MRPLSQHFITRKEGRTGLAMAWREALWAEQWPGLTAKSSAAYGWHAMGPSYLLLFLPPHNRIILSFIHGL